MDRSGEIDVQQFCLEHPRTKPNKQQSVFASLFR
jgi:hypothetical protein